MINTGTISAASAGIFLGGIGVIHSFSGGVTNRGRIIAGTTGIRLEAPSGLTVAGNVVNTGTISGQCGLGLLNGLISGAIIDSGAIVASGPNGILAEGNVTRGINVAAGGKVVVSGTSGADIAVHTATFTGGITNAGIVSALHGRGIYISEVQTFIRRTTPAPAAR